MKHNYILQHRISLIVRIAACATFIISMTSIVIPQLFIHHTEYRGLYPLLGKESLIISIMGSSLTMIVAGFLLSLKGDSEIQGRIYSEGKDFKFFVIIPIIYEILAVIATAKFGFYSVMTVFAFPSFFFLRDAVIELYQSYKFDYSRLSYWDRDYNTSRNSAGWDCIERLHETYPESKSE